MRFHGRRGEQRKRPCDGQPVWAFGFRAGYWPCLGAVFIKVDYGPRFIEAAIGPTRPAWWAEEA